MPPKVEREALIADFQRVADELGKRPTLTEYNEMGEYSSTPIYERFESFEALKEAAGFERGEKKISDDELLEDLCRVADEIGRSPPVEAYEDLGNHNSKTLKRRWGNWHDTLEAAGLEATRWSGFWSDNEEVQFDKQYGSVEVECSYCGEIITRKPYDIERWERHFCDSDCKYRHLSEKTGEEAPAWEGGEVEYTCEVCGETATTVPARQDQRRFCSRECMLEWHKQEFSGPDHHNWRGGYEPYYGPDWREQRRRAWKRDDNECQICGMGQEEHKEEFGKRLSVHHIERFASFDDPAVANELPNLITVCRPHHRQLEHEGLAIPEGRRGAYEEWAVG